MPLLWLASCTKDKGNYDYVGKEIISITGVESYYSRITPTERLVIEPVVTSNKDAEFEYFWGMIKTNGSGSVSVFDTLTKTKNLNYLVEDRAKDWVLIFSAKNKKTGYANLIKVTLNVATEFTKGWYVIKDEAGQTDADLFFTPQTIVPGTAKNENIYSVINGKKLEGKAIMFNFFDDYKTNVTGVLASTRTLFMVSDKDMSAVDISTLKEIRGFNSIFVGAPAVKAPAAVLNEPFIAEYIINDGQLHGLSTINANIGQFGGRKLKDNDNTPYHLSKYYITYLQAPFFFDEMSSSFVTAVGGNTFLTAVSDHADTQLKANNNNKKLIYMGLKTQSPLLGYAIFQDKTNLALKTLTEVIPAKTGFRMNNDVLSPTDKIYNGTNFAVIYQDESMIYFSVGREIWSRNLANKFEQLQYTVPAGEEVTFIKHRKYTGSGVQAPYTYNYVMVGTKSGGNYKVRMFTKSSGNLNAQPAFILEGKGNAADAIFISPAIGGTTYPSTF